MTENEWLGSTDWLTLWHFADLSSRKARLLAVAACRELQHLVSDDRLRRMLELAEEWADADAEPDDALLDRREDWYDEADSAAHALPGGSAERTAAWAYVGLGNDESKIGRALESVAAVYGCPAMTAGVRPSRCPQVARTIRESVGNPFRPVAFSPEWRTDTAVLLARGMYESRDFAAMPILADALQDAGCDNADVLDHCRGAGPHVRGCWVVDAVLEKV